MSSYINTSIHFNSVENRLIDLAYDNNFDFDYKLCELYPRLDRYTYKSKEIENTISGIMDEIRKLTVLCVTLQYKQHYVGTLDKEIQEQTTDLLINKLESKALSNLSLLKALKCINYQIELVHLTEIRPLCANEKRAYTFLELMINCLALDICDKLPEYTKAPWSIN